MQRVFGGLMLLGAALAGCEGELRPGNLLDGGQALLDAQVEHVRVEAGPPAADSSLGPTMDAATSVAPSYEVCSADGWCFDRPRPTAHALLAGVHMGGRDLWLLGEHGTVLRFDGSGIRGESTTVVAPLRAGWAISPTDAWAVGDDSTFMHFDGQVWSEAPLDAADAGSAPRDSLRGVWGASSSELWAVGSEGVLYRYGALGWVRQAPIAGVQLNAIWGAAADRVIAVGEAGWLAEYDGSKWTPRALKSKALRSIHGTSANDIWIVGAAGAVFHYDGQTYTPVPPPVADADLYAVRALAPGRVVVSGAGGTLYEYDGQTWTPRPTGVVRTLVALLESEDGALIGLGDHGTVVRLEGERRTLYSAGSAANYLDLFGADGAQFVVGDELLRVAASGYSALPSASSRSLYGGFALTERLGWAVGTAGTIVQWDGARFQDQESGSSSWLRDVWASSPTSAWVVGAKGTMLGLFNGVSWQSFAVPATQDLYDVWGTGPADVWAVGDGGTVLHWDGARWSPVPTPAASAGLRAVWGSAPDDVWVVGTLGTLLHWDGATWTLSQMSEGYTLNGLWGRARNDVYAVGSSGVVLHYDGKDWKREATPTGLTLFAVGAGPSANSLRAVGERGVILYRR